MITRVNERQIKETGEDEGGETYQYNAVVRDGKVVSIDSTKASLPNIPRIRSYIKFLNEILEAIDQTK